MWVRAPARTPTGNTWQEYPRDFPYKCHDCQEKGYKAAQCGKEQGNGQGNHSIYGVDDGDAGDNGAESVQGLRISASVRMRKSGKSTSGESVRASRRTPRQGWWASASLLHGPSTSIQSRASTLWVSSPGRMPAKPCTPTRPRDTGGIRELHADGATSKQLRRSQAPTKRKAARDAPFVGAQVCGDSNEYQINHIQLRSSGRV